MITDEQKAILAHGIIEVDDWLRRTIGSPYEAEIQRQIERLRPLYEAEKDSKDYKTAAEKAETERLKMMPAQPVKPIDEIIAETVQAELDKRGYTDATRK